MLLLADTESSDTNLYAAFSESSDPVVSENGFPKGNLSKVGQDEAGKVFRYTKIEVLKIGRRKSATNIGFT